MRLWIVPVVVLIAVACAPTAPAASPSAERTAPDAASARPSVQRTLVIIGGRAAETLSSKPLREERAAGRPRATMRTFNAGLALNDERELPHPYLAETLPQLNSDSWRVLPDGRMETTFRLKPNLTWHDDHALTAEDFVFSFRVYSTPEMGLSASPPLNYMDDVQAPDPRTVVVRWRQLYADAADLQMMDFPPLPRHILEATFAQGNADAFVALPFWLTDYVGAGPFKVTRVELGSSVEATAFDGHVLGRPKIDQLRFSYITDANTALANLLSGAGNVATDSSIDLQQVTVLDNEWVARGTGVVLRNPTGVRQTNFQLRPEFATPRTLLDVRVRKALAYATDRQALADALTEGLGTTAEAMVLPQLEYYPDLERVMTTYPYDPRRADQLLNEAGYARAADGFYTSPTDGRFTMEVAVAQGGRNDTEVQIMADGLRKLGIDASIRIIPRAQITEPYVLANFPGVLVGSQNPASIPPLGRLRASEIASPATRGRGSNFSGWNNAEAERLIMAYETALDRAERNQYAVQLLKLVSEEVPLQPLYYNLEFVAHDSRLRGPMVTVSSDSTTWNLHEWAWER